MICVDLLYHDFEKNASGFSRFDCRLSASVTVHGVGKLKKFVHGIRRIFRFCLEVALGGAFVNADTLPLKSRRNGTRLAARKRSVRQVPASFHGLLITNAPSRATFQSKAKKVQTSCENGFTSCIFPHPVNSNPQAPEKPLTGRLYFLPQFVVEVGGLLIQGF